MKYVLECAVQWKVIVKYRNRTQQQRRTRALYATLIDHNIWIKTVVSVCVMFFVDDIPRGKTDYIYINNFPDILHKTVS